MAIVIVRPPLIYGNGAPGNLERLMRLASLPIPLPLGSVGNKRTLLSRDRLIEALVRCLHLDSVVGRTLILSDEEDISTTQLLQSLRRGLKVRSPVFPFPPSLLWVMARLLGKHAEVQRLTSSLQVDGSFAAKLLNLSPGPEPQQSIEEMAHYYLMRKRGKA